MSCKQLVKIIGICHYPTVDIEDDKIDPRLDLPKAKNNANLYPYLTVEKKR